jgi:hypothetical protein
MLSQADADGLLGMPKRYSGASVVKFAPGADVRADMQGIPHPEERFMLDLWRGRRNVVKIKFQTRGRNIFVLARLDINGAPHVNPDGRLIEGTHLHLYTEEYGTRVARPVGPADFSDLSDLNSTFAEFCQMCSIVGPPVLDLPML